LVIRAISELILDCLVSREALAKRGKPREEYRTLDEQIFILMKLADTLELYEELTRTVVIPQKLKDEYWGRFPVN